MKIKDMIEILQAAERGEKIECKASGGSRWYSDHPIWNFAQVEYRIAPKKQELSLVEEFRTLNPQFYSEWKDLAARAADRIEDLEGFSKKSLYCYTTDELLADIKRRIEG